MKRVGAFVLNHNMREMTERLIDRIRETTHEVDVKIFNVDAASRSSEVVLNADQDLLLGQNRRWAWSFYKALMTYQPEGYDYYWCLCNDAQIVDDGTLDVLVRTCPDDAAFVHPYQKTHPAGSSQGKQGQGLRTSSFVEFVCPLLTARFVDTCVQEFNMPGISDGFPMGWGVDYEMAHLAHRLGMKGYICQDVGIIHEPGTTHRHHEHTQVEPDEVMRRKARNSMLDVLEERYGKDWGQVFAQSALDAGVDPQPFLDWSHYDRQLSLSGARA